jgi:hypothetical protein
MTDIKRYSDAMDIPLPFSTGNNANITANDSSGPPLPEGHTDGGMEISKVEGAAVGSMGVLRRKLVDLTNLFGLRMPGILDGRWVAKKGNRRGSCLMRITISGFRRWMRI